MIIRDGLIYHDEETGEEWIFNYKTFYELVVGCVKKYGDKTDNEAREIVDNSFIVNEPPKNIMALRLLDHESEYHWAMILLHGEEYWQKIPNSYPPPDEYFAWCYQYQKQNNLAEDVIKIPD